MISKKVDMEKLILIVNKMQDTFSQTGTNLLLDLPQIAVVGSQSAGKSSVLENFVGRDFLPRGSGVVTRRPLILQLINGPEEYGEFAHCNGKKFVNFDKIRSEIEAETDRGTGTNKGISNVPINLRIYSPHVLNLTLVDLPGLTKNPVGDQPANVESQIKEMIFQFIRKENCLILAVSPANSDLANSDALHLAREVDKDGERTIGVITKLDLMDKGTDARDIFDGKLLPLRRGYVGVVNRSQKDIGSRKDIATALKDERDFFLSHDSYRDIADRLGTPYLQQVLNQQLSEHILKMLPILEDNLRNQMVSLKNEIAEYENLHPKDPVVMRKVILDVIGELQMHFQREIGSLDSVVIETDRLTSGAKIKHIFHERLPNELSRIQHDKNKLQNEIKYAIANLHGIDVGLFPPFKAFKVLVRKQILKLEEPIRMCIDLVIEELLNAVQMSIQNMTSYPKFRDFIHDNIMSFIHENGPLYRKNILSLVKMESSYMNTKHDEFISNQRSRSGIKCRIHIGEELINNTIDKLNGSAISDSDDNSSEISSQKSFDVTICEGFLYIEHSEIEKENGKIASDSKPHWFVLTSTTLSCYKKIENKKMFTLPLDGLQLRDVQRDSKHIFALYRLNGRRVYQGYEQLELSCENENDLNSWKQAFSLAINNFKSEPDMTKLGLLDADVHDLYEKVISYLRIVRKTLRDMVPKAMTLYIIKDLEHFINKELLGIIFAIPNDDYSKIFTVDPVEAGRFEAKKKMYETCKNALDMIRM